MEERIILHSDFNAFYASVEMLYDPSLRKFPMAVTGDAESRHGIILSKNDIAKRFNVKTGESMFEAKGKCPDIKFVTADHEKYMRYAKMSRRIYVDCFSPLVESFGLDEAWLDVTGCGVGDGKEAADKVRATMIKELGLTVSVGASFNKIFAKLGSDVKKPNGTTVIGRGDYKEKAWPLPVSELLFVGRATTMKLTKYGVRTIGDLANTDVKHLQSWLGVNGVMLWRFANGEDKAPISAIHSYDPVIKSVGNSTTTPHDLKTDDDIKITLYSLSESVSSRLREKGFLCSTVQVYIRDNGLLSCERQKKLLAPVNGTLDLFEAAYVLVKDNKPANPIRSLGVRACGLSAIDDYVQLSVFPDEVKAIKRRDIDNAIGKIRDRYGYHCIKRGITYLDPVLSLDARKDNAQGGFLSESKGL